MSRLKRIGRWVAFVFCFVGIPGLLIFFGINYLKVQGSQNRLDNRFKELGRLYQELRRFSDPQNFWCSMLKHKFAPDTIKAANAAENIVDRIKEIRKNLRFNYVIFSPQSRVIATSQPLVPEEDWALALSLAWKVITPGRPDVSEAEHLAGGRIFGPQLYWEHFKNNLDADDPYLVWADSRYHRPVVWARIVHKYLIMVFIDHADLASNDGLWNFLMDYRKNSGGQFGFSIHEAGKGYRHADLSPDLVPELERAAADYERQKSQQITTARLVVFPMFLKPGLIVFGYMQKSLLDDNSLNGPILALALLFFACAGVLGRYSWRLIVAGEPDSLSLRWKLRFLFFFANGLPLLVLFFIGNDYLNQKRDNLLLEMHGKGISFLQDFDEKIEIEYARRLVGKQKAEEKLIEKLSHQEINDQTMGEFYQSLGGHAWKSILVASRSNVIGTEKGIYDESRKIIPQEFEERGDRSKNQMEFTRKVGQFFLDKINGAKIAEKTATELELFVESTTQKPLANFLFDLLQKRGNFIQWGFGQNVHPAILDTFSLKNSSSMDFFFLASFKLMELQYDFLQQALPQANRNNLGLKVIALHDVAYTVPKEAFNNTALREFAMTLTPYPGKEIKFVNFNDSQYLAMGFGGKHIKDYKLIGLFPIERVDSVIASQKAQLLLFAILSLLLTFGLSQVLAQGFIVPLQLITSGALAIENKHFSHRLPDLGRDEFGAMGKVFNDVMVDLEELSVASAIQEQLLPQQQVATGLFSLFGRSVSMGELGGDYYDFLALENGRFSVLLGDVAGHGVGAALIMAMAKAGVIQSEHMLDKPQTLLNRLHNLIYLSKTKKQKKIMTFQYLYLDGMAGRGIYANAGACSPMIIRKTAGTVEELTLAGAALGAFKKANFSEVELIFNPGDAIVFYTDGIVEARNSKGEELGYDRLRHLLLETWDIDAEVFYQNIYRAYLRHIGDEAAQDDLTMVVLVFNPDLAKPTVDSEVKSDD